MSKYKEIEVGFKNAETLLAVLKELGLEVDMAIQEGVNDLAMNDYYGNRMNVAMAVTKQSFQKAAGLGHSYGSVAFKYDNGEYKMIADHLDKNTGVINSIRQNYTRKEVTRLARMKGYSVREQASSDGVVRLQLVAR